ncbi:sulfotransferase domain-containing protein [Shewanella goraebulensis]|uniref:sulfotransferase domain-containing protein n=1 Tax=Shewanella goraebulensis TaxID=3050637 RepID=UPI00254A51C8|nr:sulfotransferase domain-containing protein [Shewanella goraebulensis]
MLVLSNGIPKSGSSYLFKLTRDLLKTSINAENAVREAILKGELEGSDLFVSNLNDKSLLLLDSISKEFGPLAVKVHEKNLDRFSCFLTQEKIFTPFTYRDPRDCILSSLDHRARTNGEVFQNYGNVSDAIPNVKSWAKSAVLYLKSDCCAIKYESLIEFPEQQLMKLAGYFGISVTQAQAEKICLDELESRKKGTRQFNTGLKNRYIHEMTSSDIDKCNIEMRDVILTLGYSLS